MKKWIKMVLASFFLFALVPMAVNAAGNHSGKLAAEGNKVSVSLTIPEGKAGAVTSLRLQLRVTANSGTMGAPTFAFDKSIGSTVQDAAITQEKGGSYLVDIILSGKKEQNLFKDSETASLGALTLNPTSTQYEIKVEFPGQAGGSGKPVVEYVDANGTSAASVELDSAEPALVKKAEPAVTIQAPKLAVKAKTGSKSLAFSWNKVTGANGYEVYEYNTKTKKDTLIKRITSPSTLKLSKSYKYASTHAFRMRAYQNGKDGARVYGKYSSIVKVTVGPEKAKGLSAYYKTDSKATISWKKVSGASGYEIYRSDKKNGKYTRVKTVKSGKTVSATLTHKKGKAFYYKVRAYVTGADKKPVYGSFCTAVTAKLKAPKLSAKVASKNVKLSWKKIPRAAGYRIYRSRTKNGKYTLVKTLTKGSAKGYVEKKPKGSSVWYYKACAFEKQGKKIVNGEFSSVVKAK
ncbi:MAG: hypothetical protein HFH38_10985 [Lachnospiraceae bacterium]|nr:hypothetical protein [Lachnospiraceae bacterium]